MKDQVTTPKPGQRKISVKLSENAGNILIGCATLVKQFWGGQGDAVTEGIMRIITGEVCNSFESNKGSNNKTSFTFQWSPIVYNLAVDIVETSINLVQDDDDGDRPFREVLLQTLRDANPVTRESNTPTREIPLVDGETETTPPLGGVSQDTGLADPRFGSEDRTRVLIDGRE